VSREPTPRLTPRAIERLLAAAAPLRERPDVGALDLERYELGEVLGRGGMGIVYAAFDRELGRRVALKVLSRPAGMRDSARQRFLREAKAAARLSHPHIATVYDATPEAIAMQRVDGETLSEAGTLDPRRLAELVRDAALAIHFAHGEGVVHRDLKPGNLMVERSSDRAHVYVMDFGLAKELAVDSSLSISGSVVGTPGYMAPEQAAGRGQEVGPQTDVYGLGATLYACLAGRPPFEGEDVYALLRSVVEEEPRPLAALVPRVDPDLATIVEKCMAKEPAQRYPSALALASDLDRWLRGEPIQARPPSLVYRLRRFVSRRQGAIAVGVAAAGVALLAALPFVIHARGRRAAAERERELADSLFELSRRVQTALSEARETRQSGVGHELGAFHILEGAIADCRAALAQTEVGYVRFFLGRLLAAQGRFDEALVALDRAGELRPDIQGLPRERGLVLAALFRDAVPVFGETPPAELETWRARALADLERSLAGEPSVPTADWIFAEGQRAWMAGDLEAAIEKHREVVEMDVAHQEAHLSLARLYSLADRVELAMRHSVIASDLMRGHRPAYVAGGNVRSSSGEPLLPDRELLPLEGLRELLVDFNLLLQIEPGDANTFGLRGQVRLRQAVRASRKGNRDGALENLEMAVREYDACLTVDPSHAAALVNRGVCNAHLARLLGAGPGPECARRALEGARADLDRALELDPALAVAHFDRALLRLRRSQIAQLAFDAEGARTEREKARADARAALLAAGEEHPWGWRFEELVEELE